MVGEENLSTLQCCECDSPYGLLCRGGDSSQCFGDCSVTGGLPLNGFLGIDAEESILQEKYPFFRGETDGQKDGPVGPNEWTATMLETLMDG